MLKNLNKIKMYVIKKFAVITAIALMFTMIPFVNAYAAIGGEPVDNSKEIEMIDPNIRVVITKIDENSIQPYSYYASSFDFHGSLYGQYRYFDGNHAGCELTSNSDKPDSTFTIKLVRQGGPYGVVVAKSDTLLQKGQYHVDFWNINNPNNYRFSFTQPTLGACHQWGGITMFSWE